MKIYSIINIINKYNNKSSKILEKLNIQLNTTGRIISKRDMGSNIFITIQDIKGNIQIFLNKKKISQLYLKHLKHLKVGNFIYIKGILFKTKTLELTIRCTKIKVLTKILKFLPDKYHKIKNPTTKIRYRYLDLIINPHTRYTFLNRIQIIKQIRYYLNKNHYLEVETPILHNIPGGAIAKPFITTHNKYNINMYLRISPELYLKQLIIGGFDKIYELNKSFRNEGISNHHNPEFTMIEIYRAYTNYKYMIYLNYKLIKYIIKTTFNNKKIFIFKQHEINFSKPYTILTMVEAIYKYSTYFKNIQEIYNKTKLRKILHQIDNTKLKISDHTGELIYKIFNLIIEKQLIQPTFITQYPIEVSPLAKKNKNNPKFTDRFELFIGGYEISNGFSELNNAEEQKERFMKQILKNKNNNKFYYNQEYINALKYGLPPTSGLGIGIDRLTMILTNNDNIKNVIFFPTVINN